MTTTATPPTLTGPTPTKPVRQRRPTWAIWLGALIIAIGALGGAALFRLGQSTVSVLTVRTNLTPGQRVTADQLGTTALPLTTGLHTIPADQIDTVVGKYAVVALPAGALLTQGAVSPTITPKSGQTVVGIGVKTSQMPAAGLVGGDHVRVVVTLGGTQNTGPAPGTAWTGTVVDRGPTNPSGVATVDVAVSTADATAVASAAGGGNVSIVLDGS